MLGWKCCPTTSSSYWDFCARINGTGLWVAINQNFRRTWIICILAFFTNVLNSELRSFPISAHSPSLSCFYDSLRLCALPVAAKFVGRASVRVLIPSSAAVTAAAAHFTPGPVLRRGAAASAEHVILVALQEMEPVVKVALSAVAVFAVLLRRRAVGGGGVGDVQASHDAGRGRRRIEQFEYSARRRTLLLYIKSQFTKLWGSTVEWVGLSITGDD